MLTALHIDIQRVSVTSQQPDDSTIQQWVQTALHTESQCHQIGSDQIKDSHIELCVRIVDEAEISALNQQYRQRSGSTNVLSFTAEKIPDIPVRILGDLVICAAVVEQEAQQQGKTLDAHWAHMIIHGVLHLCGYDHIDDIDAERMESREQLILKKLGFSNPYEVK
jgi:probable rRNA maturation factor